ncbi:M23 family metallopeptidase, partial [Tannerella forsythia]
MNKWKKMLLVCLGLTGLTVSAQTFRSPVDIPILLSGNFGELRNNHFHSGIDFKTQGVEGKNIRAVKDGYVSRILVSPWGYGHALYVKHPDSTMSVYGHLRNFAGHIATYVKEQQYAQERFSVDLSPEPSQFPVKAGELIALSGNTGSSGGPHLHFEIRDLRTGEPVDPIVYYKDKIKDTRPPKVRSVMICPVGGQGVVNGSQQKQRIKVVTAKDGRQSVTGKTEAWGKIGFSIHIDDYMNGTSNVYGVKEITMRVDGKEMFHSYQGRFSFDETRYLNAWVDFAEWRGKKSFYTKTFVEPGNRLRFMTSKNRGYLTVDEARTYHIEFELTDAFGNTGRLALAVTGRPQTILPPDTAGATHFYHSGENRFGASGIRMHIPRGNLYNDLYFRHSSYADTAYYSEVHTVHDTPVPLHRNGHLSLHLLADTLADKGKYGIVSVDGRRKNWIGGSYRDGWIDADITELGKRYAVDADTVPPVITAVDSSLWRSKEMIILR